MFVRDADAGDVSVIELIETTAVSPWSASQIADEFVWKSGVRLAACKEDGTIIGWCCARFLPPEAELNKITVHPEHRRKGIGSILVDTLVKRCKEACCNVIFLEVRQKNTAAIRLYQRSGFIEDGLRKQYFTSPPDHGLLMRKAITE